MITDLIGKVIDSLDELFTSDEERGQLENKKIELKNKLTKIFTDYDMASQEVNKIEAAGNMFSSSWRPLLAYICVFSFAYKLIQPFFELPDVDLTSATEMLYYLLGYSGLRTFEKFKGLR